MHKWLIAFCMVKWNRIARWVSHFFLQNLARWLVCTDLVLESFLLFTDPYHKQVYQLPTAGGDDALPVVRGVAMPTDAQFPISVDVLADRGLVYWIDSTASRIMSTHFTKDQHSVVAQLPPGGSVTIYTFPLIPGLCKLRGWGWVSRGWRRRSDV